jgi:hypothetical protein
MTSNARSRHVIVKGFAIYQVCQSNVCVSIQPQGMIMSLDSVINVADVFPSTRIGIATVV